MTRYTLSPYLAGTHTPVTGDEVERHALNALRNVRGESHLQRVLTAIADALDAGQTVTIDAPEPRETVETWCDASGVWHARVTFPGRGYGPDYLGAQWDAIRAKARRAIRRQIGERPGLVVRIYVKDNNLDHMNCMRSVTFAER